MSRKTTPHDMNASIPKTIVAIFSLLAMIIIAGVVYSINSIQDINDKAVEPYLAIMNNNLGVNPKILKIISHIQDYQAEANNKNLRQMKKVYRIMKASILNDLDSEKTMTLHGEFGDLERVSKIVDGLKKFDDKFEQLEENNHKANLKQASSLRKKLGRLYSKWNNYSRRVIQNVQQAQSDTWDGWNYQLKLQLYFLLLIAVTSILAIAIMYYLYRRQLQTGIALENQSRELNEARILAEQSTRAKSRFLANMSHEIRTPLNGIIGLSKLAFSKVQDKETRAYIENIVLSGNSLLQIINDVLDISKIEANKITLEEADFLLEDVTKSLATSMSFAAKAKQVSFVLLTPPSLSIGLRGDSTKLTQIITNLCSNAIKFTELGGVSLSIQVKEECDKTMLTIQVKDTGIGLNREQQRQIFKEFVQADDSTTRKFGGTGLGLSISRNFVEMMGGNISVDSELHQGSTFTVDIPFAKPETPHSNTQNEIQLSSDDEAKLSSINIKVVSPQKYEIEQITADLKRFNLHNEDAPFTHVLFSYMQNPPDIKERITTLLDTYKLPGILFVSNDVVTEFKDLSDNTLAIDSPYSTNKLLRHLLGHRTPEETTHLKPALRALKGKKILVAEDNKINQLVVNETLKELGASLTFADNGLQCIERLREADFDLILMDIQMPEMDGLEATRIIIAEELAPNTPIVALTANVFKEDIETYIKAGMDAHLPKPFDPEALCHLIQKLTR